MAMRGCAVLKSYLLTWRCADAAREAAMADADGASAMPVADIVTETGDARDTLTLSTQVGTKVM